MHRHTWLVAVVAVVAALAGCGAKAGGDDCQKVFDKMAPVIEKTAGKPMPQADRDKGIAECRDHMAKHAGDKEPDSDTLFVKCIVAADGDDAIKACMSGPMKEYAKKTKKIEAQLQLHRLLKNLKVYYIESSAMVAGKAGPTPAAPCCSAPDKKCPVDASWAKDPTWSALGFSIDEPTLYQYSYQSDGKTATATAVGDLDCDGKAETYTLNVTVQKGVPDGKITAPDGK
jgi:hypothetical protein